MSHYKGVREIREKELEEAAEAINALTPTQFTKVFAIFKNKIISEHILECEQKKDSNNREIEKLKGLFVPREQELLQKYLYDLMWLHQLVREDLRKIVREIG